MAEAFLPTLAGPLAGVVAGQHQDRVAIELFGQLCQVGSSECDIYFGPEQAVAADRTLDVCQRGDALGGGHQQLHQPVGGRR